MTSDQTRATESATRCSAESLHTSFRAEFGNVPKDSIRVQPLMHIGGLLRDLGTSPEDVFSASDLPANLFGVPENTISFAQIKRLMQNAVSATGCDHFGLLLGETALANPLGLLGEVSRHCGNIGTAIAYFQQYFHLHDRIGIATRSVDGHNGSIGYLLFEGNCAEADQVHDAGIAIGMSLMRAWAGSDWRPRAVTLPRRKPRSVDPYRKVFGIVPQFECEHPALHFDARDFARPILGADAAQFALLSEKIETVACGRDLNFSDQVRRTMRGLIALRNCSADDVASAFAMSRRNMNRKLMKEGTNYQLLHDEARCAMAERMLLRTDKPLVEISVALNYSDATAFSRAFKGWHGCSPREWRAAHQTI